VRVFTIMNVPNLPDARRVDASDIMMADIQQVPLVLAKVVIAILLLAVQDIHVCTKPGVDMHVEVPASSGIKKTTNFQKTM
jgi:hypothetical protein